MCTLSLLSMIGCSAPDDPIAFSSLTTPLIQASGIQLPSPVSEQIVNFNIQLPTNHSFRTKQTANATHVKLTITNGTTTVFAAGADGNGFNSVGGNNPLALTATVSTGNNWVATAGFYSNNNDGALIQEFKTAFHVPVTGTVEISMRTFLMGKMVEELQNLNSPELATALDLNAYQAFVDNLTGFSVGPPIAFTTDPLDFDARQLSTQISNNTIVTVDGATGTTLSANPANFVELPFEGGQYQAQAGTQGIKKTVAINPANGNVFAYDDDLATNNFHLYGLGTTINGDSTVTFAENHKAQYGIIDSRYVTLGIANPTGTAQVPAIFYVRENGGNRELRAVRQDNPATQLWVHTLPQSSASKWGLVTRLDDNGTAGDPTDDQDIVYTAFTNGNSTSTTTSGIRAVRNGTDLWTYNHTKLFSSGGALSNDGNTLYVNTYEPLASSTTLIGLDTSNGNEKWTETIAQNAQSRSGPVVGSDERVYLITHDVGFNSSLHSVTPGPTSATINWTQALGTLAVEGYSFESPIIDNHGAQDVIYLQTSKGYLWAVNHDQSFKWANPHSMGAGAFGSPLLVGEEPSAITGQQGKRVIYVGGSNSRIYAIRDNGTTSEEAWSQSFGSFWQGFNLKDNYLYYTTLNGGDANFVLVKAIKVNTPNVPATAPWPQVRGDMQGRGRGQ